LPAMVQNHSFLPKNFKDLSAEENTKNEKNIP